MTDKNCFSTEIMSHHPETII